jgi:hypothetical protein
MDSMKSGGEEMNIGQNPALEQWKFYGKTTRDVSNRRLKNNRFYLRLLIGLLGIAGIGTKLDLIDSVGILAIGVVGFPFCLFWLMHILSYKQLNSGKYRVLWKMAEDLPYAPFETEWDQLESGENWSTYIPHTMVEAWWPRVLGLIYFYLIIYGTLSFHDSLDLYWWAVGTATLLWAGYAMWVLWKGGPLKSYWKYTGSAVEMDD